MNVLNRFGGAALALALLCGCGSRTHVPSALLARADPPAPAAQKARPLPAWAQKFTSATAMIGKTRKELYEAFGVPAHQVEGRYQGSQNYETVAYVYRGEYWDLTVEFDNLHVVAGCMLTFEQYKPEKPSVANQGGYYKTELLIGTASVWDALGAPGSKPESCYVDKMATQEQKQSWEVRPNGMSGKAKDGREIFLALGKPMAPNASASVLLTCKRAFNPDTSRLDSPTVTVRTGYSWKVQQVRTIATDPSMLGHEDYTRGYYLKYPVP